MAFSELPAGTLCKSVHSAARTCALTSPFMAQRRANQHNLSAASQQFGRSSLTCLSVAVFLAMKRVPCGSQHGSRHVAVRTGRASARAKAGSSQDASPSVQITSRIRLWRALASGDAHTIGTLAQAAGISSGEARHHLEHVMKQARTLKNKSTEWRAMRAIPMDWDPSGVRVQVTPATCEDCGWVAKFARSMGNVRCCKRCGSREVTPILIRLVFSARS